MEEIKAYLANKDKNYMDGVMLFQKHGKNGHLMRLFLLKETQANFDKLIYELEKLAKKEDSKSVKSEIETKVSKTDPIVTKTETSETETGKNLPEGEKSEAEKISAEELEKQFKEDKDLEHLVFENLPQELAEMIVAARPHRAKRKDLQIALGEVPQDNEPQSIEARKAIIAQMDEIDAILKPFELINAFYEKEKRMPTLEEIETFKKEKAPEVTFKEELAAADDIYKLGDLRKKKADMISWFNKQLKNPEVIANEEKVKEYNQKIVELNEQRKVINEKLVQVRDANKKRLADERAAEKLAKQADKEKSSDITKGKQSPE